MGSRARAWPVVKWAQVLLGDETGCGMGRGKRSPLESGGKPLAGGAGGPREQAQEGGAPLGQGGKLCHVADARGKGYRGGPATEQGQKPLRGLPARVVAVEGEEDAGTAPGRVTVSAR